MVSRQRRTAVRLLAGGAAAIAVIMIAGLAGLRVNLTPSYPIGLWRIVQKNADYGAGDVVFICPPDDPLFELALERGYIPRGLCPGGTGPLIKTIAAMSGQSIAIDAAVMIDGRPVVDSQIKISDEWGRSLFPAKSGVVPADHLFLLSNYSGSFDSRYFGPLPTGGLLGLAQPVLTYAR